MKNHYSGAMKCVKLHVKGVDNISTTQEDQHHTPRILIITEQDIHNMTPVENDRKNIHQMSTVSIWYHSLFGAGSKSRKFTSLLEFSLFNCFLGITSDIFSQIICRHSYNLWHHLSHRISLTLILYFSSCLYHRQTFVHSFSLTRITCIIIMAHNNNTNIASPSSLLFVACYDLSFDTAPQPPTPNFHDRFVSIQ